MPYKDPHDPRALEQRRKHYYANKQAYLKRNREVVNKRKAWVNYKKSVPCADCGHRYPAYVMDFDHRDPSIKVNNVSVLVSWSWKRLMAEVEKCDVVCSNCHRERTHNRDDS